MRKITQTIVGTTPPLDKNVLWLDTTNSNSPVEKVFLNGAWIPTSAAGGEYYTKDEVDENFMGKIDNPNIGNILVMDENGKAVDSRTKPADFLTNAVNEGQDGQVLSLQSSGPAWVNAPQGTVIVDDIVQDSPNPVKNSAIKQYVDNANYAKKDGYYSQMTVGAAETLVGETVDSEAYLIRPTGGESNEVANGVASVLSMEGNSCVWNQLFNASAGTTFNIAEGASYPTLIRSTTPVPIIEGHVYYRKPIIKITSGTMPLQVYQAYLQGSGGYMTPNVGNIFTATSTNTDTNSKYSPVLLRSASAAACSGTISFVQIDLTAIFGAGNEPSTVAEFEAWLAKNVGLKPYYSYNAGTLLSVQTLGIKTYGQNLLNPTTRQAKLIPYTWEENSNVYTIKNVPSANDLQITYTPDATGEAVTIYSYDSENPTPIPDSIKISDYGGSGVLYISSATTDTYVCMKWNGKKYDEVVPYEDPHTYDFDVKKVYGKVNGEGEYVQCFPNGMMCIRNIKDTLSASKAVVRIAKIVFDGTENWGSVAVDANVISFGIGGGVGFSTSLGICNFYKYDSSSYIIGTFNLLWKQIKWMNIYEDVTKYPNDTAWKNHLASLYANGTPLTIEYVLNIANRITYTDLIYRNNGIDRPLANVLMNIEVNNWSMEEQLMTPYVDSNPTSIPATIKTQYGMDAVESIDTLQKTCYFADDVKANLQALLTCINTNCAETLGGTFSVSDTATDKVFAFTFTPNTEPDVEPTNEGE